MIFKRTLDHSRAHVCLLHQMAVRVQHRCIRLDAYVRRVPVCQTMWQQRVKHRDINVSTYRFGEFRHVSRRDGLRRSRGAVHVRGLQSQQSRQAHENEGKSGTRVRTTGAFEDNP